MDFLNSVKKQLAEMEEQARLLQAMEASGVSKGPDGHLRFQPRNPGQAQGGQKPAGGKNKNKKQQRQKNKGQGQARQQQSQPRSLVSREEVFETPHCVSEGAQGPPASTETVSLQARVLNTLYGRSDEAFLLSEILGPPRCMKGWADD